MKVLKKKVMLQKHNLFLIGISNGFDENGEHDNRP
jgi:hypothetical protein